MASSAKDFKVRYGVQTNGLTAGYVAKTGTYAITTQDYLVDCTANSFTVTLPTAVGCAGRIYIVKNSGTGTITVDTTSSQTIDAKLTRSVGPYDTVTFTSNGANWLIAGQSLPKQTAASDLYLAANFI